MDHRTGIEAVGEYLRIPAAPPFAEGIQKGLDRKYQADIARVGDMAVDEAREPSLEHGSGHRFVLRARHSSRTVFGMGVRLTD